MILLSLSPPMVQFSSHLIPEVVVVMVGISRIPFTKNGALGKYPGFRYVGKVTSHSIFHFTQVNHLFSLEELKYRSVGCWVHEYSNVIPVPPT